MEGIKPKFALLSFLIAVAAYLLPLPLAEPAHRMLFVMVFVALLWITESAPLHATALLAGALLVVVVGIKPADVFAPYFDPVIVLLLGGFVIAVAMSKYRLDDYIAFSVITRAGTDARLVVLALMATATFISMWISNSATAAIVMPIAVAILVKNRMKTGQSNFGKAAVLAVGYGATIGGIGTIIGSTPNMIAAKFLNDAGVSFGFTEWLWRAFPYTIALMLVGWVVLIKLFPPEQKRVRSCERCAMITPLQMKVGAIFGLTVLLWVTESMHGIHNSVIALVPIVLFYFTGLLTTEDFLRVDWPTLMLVGGGLALGMGMHATGLDQTLASAVAQATGGQGILTLFLLLGIFGVLLTALISNTTAAAVYLPIVVALASAFGTDVSSTVVAAAIGVSLDFIFPFGTPPTAIAYGTRYVGMKDIAKAGVVISALGVLLLAGMGMLW